MADFLGGHLAAFGQFAHLGGHHGKALAVLAGAGGFDGGVQRQQIGLVGDVVDDADARGDFLHGVAGATYGLAAFSGFFRGLGGHAVGDAGVFGVLGNRGGDLLNAGGGFFHSGGLLAGGLRQRLRGGRHL